MEQVTESVPQEHQEHQELQEHQEEQEHLEENGNVFLNSDFLNFASQLKTLNDDPNLDEESDEF